MSASDNGVTALLNLAGRGDRQAQDELFRRVESVLRTKAEQLLRREPPDSGVQTTMLVDDAFLQLVGNHSIHWENRSQFYCWAARVMRQHLVNLAHERLAEKRAGGERPFHMDQVPEPADPKSLDPFTVVALDEALSRLAATHPDLIELVELHAIGGWELKEVAEVILRVSYRTVKRKWQLAKALLRREMNGDDHGN
jgi:RNA polymerase sigma factor (TIGR02999 family)